MAKMTEHRRNDELNPAESRSPWSFWSLMRFGMVWEKLSSHAGSSQSPNFSRWCMRSEECAQQTRASLMWLIYPLEFTPLNLFAVRNWFIHDFQLFPFSIRNWQNAATQSNYITHLLVFPFKWWAAKFFYQFDNTWNKTQNTVLFATKICHAMNNKEWFYQGIP